MVDTVRNVLFLCTGNSARSVIGECLMTALGGGRFRAFSAGSHPRGAVHPMTLAVLAAHGHPIGGLRSKSWDEFTRPGAPEVDIVITVCDAAAAETCPVWPGAPVRAHWGIPDPAAATGSSQDIEAAFARAYARMEQRVGRFLALPLERLDGDELKRKLAAIGALDDSEAAA